MSSLRNGHYSVTPRYTSGSPASVDADTAERVATQERSNYERLQQGVYGANARATALEQGLNGIVEYRCERRGGWDIEDLITGRKCRREQVQAKKLLPGDLVLKIVSGHLEGSPLDHIRVRVVGASVEGQSTVVYWRGAVAPGPILFGSADLLLVERLVET